MENMASLSLDVDNLPPSVALALLSLETQEQEYPEVWGQFTDLEHRDYLFQCYEKAVAQIPYADVNETPPVFDVLYHKYARRGKWSAVVHSEKQRIRFKKRALALRASPRAKVPTVAKNVDIVSKLAQLTIMHKDGDLSNEEFKLAKQKILKD